MDEDEPTPITEKYMKDIDKASTIAIIGKKRSGKTTVIKLLLYYLSPYVRVPVLISQTAGVTRDYEGFFPQTFVHERYDPRILEHLLNYQISFANSNHRRNVKAYGLFVMDDVTAQKKLWSSDPQFISLYLEGRHYNTCNILAVHDASNIPKELRGNIDYMIITSEHRATRRKFIFENFWPEQFGNRKVFDSVLEQATEGFHSLLIDVKKSGEPGATFSNCIFYINPPHPKRIPVRKLGSSAIWKKERMYYNGKVSSVLANKRRTTKKKPQVPQFILE